MLSTSAAETASSFTNFGSLSIELRLKIWFHVGELTPPQLISFYLCKSDLDYLRPRRKSCHNYPHIFARRMERVPSILHTCREARAVGLQRYSLGFDLSRILSLGLADRDIETYTTCSHEISMEEERKAEIYWDKTKDVIFFDSIDWLDSIHAAYVWGGKTGVKFGKMKRVAMNFDTMTSCGLGEYLQWEGVDWIFVLLSNDLSEDMLRKSSTNWALDLEARTRLFIKNKGVFATDGTDANVKFGFENLGEIMYYVTQREV